MADMKKIEDLSDDAARREDIPEAAEQLPEEADAEIIDEEAEEAAEPEQNYEEIARRDVSELHEIFPELFMLTSITQLENPMRYAALRDLGLSPKEAYLATTTRPHIRYDGKSHMRGSVPIGAFGQSASMSAGELAGARELFGDLSDSEIQKLYKRVIK